MRALPDQRHVGRVDESVERLVDRDPEPRATRVTPTVGADEKQRPSEHRPRAELDVSELMDAQLTTVLGRDRGEGDSPLELATGSPDREHLALRLERWQDSVTDRIAPPRLARLDADPALRHHPAAAELLAELE